MVQELSHTQDQTVADRRGDILALEEAMRGMPESQIQIEVIHHFAPGTYVREIILPPDVCLTGKIHKTAHVSMLTQGEITLVNEHGSQRIKAPFVVVSEPGTKRAMLSHELSRWVTIHPNPDDGQDVEMIEERLIAKSFEALAEHLREQTQLIGGE